MSEPGYVIFGIIAGFIIAALPGPIWLLCFHRTLAEGRNMGCICGLGVATADTIYAAIAAFGLSAVTQILFLNATWMQIIGGCFLCLLGIRVIISKPLIITSLPTKKGFLAAYSSMFFLTIANPLTILLFAGLVAALGVGSQDVTYSPDLLVFGIFLGSVIWWILLSSAAELFQKTISSKGLTWINHISGSILCIFGVLAVLRVLMYPG